MAGTVVELGSAGQMIRFDCYCSKFFFLRLLPVVLLLVLKFKLNRSFESLRRNERTEENLDNIIISYRVNKMHDYYKYLTFCLLLSFTFCWPEKVDIGERCRLVCALINGYDSDKFIQQFFVGQIAKRARENWLVSGYSRYKFFFPVALDEWKNTRLWLARNGTSFTMAFRVTA